MSCSSPLVIFDIDTFIFVLQNDIMSSSLDEFATTVENDLWAGIAQQ